MIDVNTKEIHGLERKLRAIADKAIPFATKSAINGAAFKARTAMQEQIRKKMVTRNKFTERSVRVELTKTLDISRQRASVGSVAPYMEAQEFGGTERKKGKHGVPIPTSTASGESRGVRPRRKVVRRPNQMQSLKLRKRGRGGKSRKQANFLAVRGAIKSGDRNVFLDLRRGKGIYRIKGGKRKASLHLLYDLSRSSVRIPKTPTLAPAVLVAQGALPLLYTKALRFQLDRLV